MTIETILGKRERSKCWLSTINVNVSRLGIPFKPLYAVARVAATRTTAVILLLPNCPKSMQR